MPSTSTIWATVVARRSASAARSTPAASSAGRSLIFMAPDALEGDQPGGRQLRVDGRNVHPGIGAEVGGELFGVAGLLQVVQLGPQYVGEASRQTVQVAMLGLLPALA